MRGRGDRRIGSGGAASSGDRPRKGGSFRRAPWRWIGLVGLVVLVLIPALRSGSGGADHPDPRPDVTAERVLPASSFAAAKSRRAYAIAAAIPGTLDGIRCYCFCDRNIGHRSLLSCFEDEHGAGCGTCRAQAELAYRLHEEGKDLEAIRAATDSMYGS